MNFNKSIIASFVGAALATTSLGVVASNVSAPYKTFSVDKVAESSARTPTVSGMRNQYDATLGKTTFNWASINTPTPDLGPVAADKRVAFAADFYLNKITGFSASKSSIAQPKLTFMI